MRGLVPELERASEQETALAPALAWGQGMELVMGMARAMVLAKGLEKARVLGTEKVSVQVTARAMVLAS